MNAHRQHVTALLIALIGAAVAYGQTASLGAQQRQAHVSSVVPPPREAPRIDRNPSGSYTWVGSLASDPLSSVQFVVNGGIVVGDVHTSTAVYSVRPAGGGHIVATAAAGDSAARAAGCPAETAFRAQRRAATGSRR